MNSSQSSKTFFGTRQQLFKILKFLNLFLIHCVHVNLDLGHFGTKKVKTIVSIAKVSEKFIDVLKLLALVCAKYIQLRFKGKILIIKTFHHLKFRHRFCVLTLFYMHFNLVINGQIFNKYCILRCTTYYRATLIFNLSSNAAALIKGRLFFNARRLLEEIRYFSSQV